MVPRVSLRGRSSELGRLLRAVVGAARGESTLTVLEGEAGIGKSALVRSMASAARAAGLRIVTIDGTDAPDAASILDRLREEAGLPRTVAVGVGGDALSLSFALAKDSGPAIPSLPDAIDVLDVLVAAPNERSVIVVVEDLHFLGIDGLDLLRPLLPRIVERGVSLVVTCRPAPRSSFVEQLLGRLETLGADRIGLGPLEPEVVAEIVEELLGAVPGDGLLRHLAGAQGNPLVVEEVVKTLADTQALRFDAGRVELIHSGAMPPLGLAVLRRTRMVRDEVLELLRIAAVLGRHFRVLDLVATTGRGEVEVIGLLEEAARTGLLADQSEVLGFRHALIHDALYRDIPVPMRVALHRRAALSLADLGAPPAQLVGHLEQAVQAGDSALWNLLWVTARAASGRSPALAVQLLSRAVAVTGPEMPEFAALLAQLALAQVRVGQGASAGDNAARALALGGPPSTELVARVALAHSRLTTSRMRDAVLEIHRAAAIHGISDIDRLRCRALGAFYQFWALDLAGAVESAHEVAREAERCEGANLDEVLGRCSEVLALGALAEGHVATALEHASRALALTGSVATNNSGTWVHQTQALALLDNDRIDEAIDVALAGLRIGEDVGALDWQIFYTMSTSMMQLVAGDLDAAELLADTALTLLDGRTGTAVAGLPYAVLARSAAYRGDHARALEAVKHAEQAFASSGPVLGSLAFLAWRAEIHLDLGEYVSARECLRLLWEIGAVAPYLLGWRTSLPLIVGAFRDDDPELAAAALEMAEVGAARGSTASARAAANRARGLFERDADRLCSAAALMRAGNRPLESICVGIEATEQLLADGRRADALELIVELSARSERRGALGLVARLDVLRSSVGIDAAARQRVPDRPKYGWDSLTVTERRVAELTAGGLTNRQIGGELGISRRTVETHLSHTFAKLGVSNRSQLAAEIGRRLG